MQDEKLTTIEEIKLYLRDEITACESLLDKINPHEYQDKTKIAEWWFTEQAYKHLLEKIK